MSNPFEIINSRLDSIEELVQRALHGNAPEPPEELGGLELAQAVTRLSKARIYSLVSERAIPHAKRGNKLYFNRADLLAWIAAGKRGNGQEKGR
ncbi:helix-turn-helix domain-containing protein [Hymenobacter jejuensis]|nr:helix-turn-helix domain-containing protein [Hymenobacter jejuensis]